MNDKLKARIAELRELAENATPGPWTLAEEEPGNLDGWEIRFPLKTWGFGRSGVGTKWETLMPTHQEELAFIAASRTALPAALETIELLVGALKEECYCGTDQYSGEFVTCDPCKALEAAAERMAK